MSSRPGLAVAPITSDPVPVLTIDDSWRTAFHGTIPIDTTILITKDAPFSKCRDIIAKLKHLTRFTLKETVNPNDKPTLNDILEILKNDPELKRVVIKINNEHEVESKFESRIELNKLEMLWLSVNRWKDAKYIISRIRIPEKKETEMVISCCPEAVDLNDALKSLNGFASSPVRMQLNFTGRNGPTIQLVGEKGTLTLINISNTHAQTVLVRRSPLALKKIEHLQLEFDNSELPGSPDPSLFPALDTMVTSGLRDRKGELVLPVEIRKFIDFLKMETIEVNQERSYFRFKIS